MTVYEQETDIYLPLQMPSLQVSSFFISAVFFVLKILTANNQTGEKYLRSKYYLLFFM